MGLHEPPLGLALILCDRVITDASTNEKTLVSLFSRITARSFPCVHPRIAVYAALTNASGSMPIELRCANEDQDNHVVFQAKGTIEFPGPNHVVEATFQINHVRFNQPGRHSVELFCQDELIVHRRFHVVQQEDKKSGQEES